MSLSEDNSILVIHLNKF